MKRFWKYFTPMWEGIKSAAPYALVIIGLFSMVLALAIAVDNGGGTCL